MSKQTDGWRNDLDLNWDLNSTTVFSVSSTISVVNLRPS